MPSFLSETCSQSASSSFGVVNRHLMSSCALQQRQRLVDDVLLVASRPSPISPPLDQLDHPARVEVDHEADAAAVLREVLDGQAQPARAGGPERQPVGALREGVVGQRVAEHLVVDAEVVDVDARLGHAGAAAGLEDVDGPARVALRHPAAHRAAAQPLVLEGAELVEVGVAVTSLRGSQPAFAAQSSQNGQPVSGSKCQAITSRTQASSRAGRR